MGRVRSLGIIGVCTISRIAIQGSLSGTKAQATVWAMPLCPPWVSSMGMGMRAQQAYSGASAMKQPSTDFEAVKEDDSMAALAAASRWARPG